MPNFGGASLMGVRAVGVRLERHALPMLQDRRRGMSGRALKLLLIQVFFFSTPIIHGRKLCKLRY